MHFIISELKRIFLNKLHKIGQNGGILPFLSLAVTSFPNLHKGTVWI